MSIFLNYEFISWSLIIFLIIYATIHLPLDIAMLKDKSGIKYPNPSFKNSLEAVLVVVPSMCFWLYIIFIPVLSLWFDIDLFNIIDLWFITTLLYGILQITGLVLMLIGLSIACLGRIGRGLYLKHKKTKLVKSWGFRIVRHPNYTFYIFNYIGLFFLTMNLFIVLFLLGIYGYYSLANTEEKSLIKHFGNEYKEYQKKVGKLIPSLRYSE